MRSAATSGRAVGTTLVVLGIVATLASLLIPVYFFDGNRSAAVSRDGWRDDGKGTWKTEYGPLTSLDREFLRDMRRSGLWQLPAGRAAINRSTTRSVQVVGEHVVAGDAELDERVIKAGRALKVTLPNRPTAAQREHLEEIENARGKEFDQIVVNHLRKANGSSFNFVGLVRDQTRNSMVRSLATRANTIVLDHIATLEDTGLVDYNAVNEGG